ncbi:hypothetical protein FQA47_022609 [Oryzias melastigma]|uniref:Uncharacterized protein n=1 Tax=Oryzias melastigma TaxID=30732 RepID=A0A834CES1_ORYME|nr:hypothetical protein FQA47_022609 [Oryzias melastigma]
MTGTDTVIDALSTDAKSPSLAVRRGRLSRVFFEYGSEENVAVKRLLSEWTTRETSQEGSEVRRQTYEGESRE